MAKTINRFVGAETGGLEEAYFADGEWAVSSANTSLLGADAYHFRIASGGAGSQFLRFDPFAYAADAGGGYIYSFDIEWASFPGTATSPFSRVFDSTGVIIRLQVTTGGVVNFDDANDSTLDSSSALSVNTKYRIEIYFEHSASANWEWWISTSDGTPVSQGSGSGADLTDGGTINQFNFTSGSDTAMGFDWNNAVFQSGVTSSDTLGEAVEVICFASDSWTAVAPATTGGDALDEGAWTNAQQVPIHVWNVDYTSGGQSGWVQADGATREPCYFDASISGPTDPDAAWTSDSNAFDGSTSTETTGFNSGSDSTNELSAAGTTAPATWSSTISQVRARIYGDGLAASEINAAIYTASKGELLGTPINNNSSSSWDDYVTLSTPTGGWTWAKANALEVYIYNSFSGSSGIAYVQLEVNHDGRIGPSGMGLTNIVAAKLVAIPNSLGTTGSGENLAPDTIAVQTNLTGSVTDIDESPDSPDANWLTASASSTLRTTFGTPTATPSGASEVHRAWVRRSANTRPPATLAPNAINSSSGYSSPVIGDFDDDPDTTTDWGTWSSGDTDLVLDFATPTNQPGSGPDLQEIRVAIKKNASGGNDPTYTIYAQDSGGSIKQTSGTCTTATGEVISLTFDWDEVTDDAGASFQVRVAQTGGSGGNPNNRRGLVCGGCEFNIAEEPEIVSYNLEVWESGVKVSGITGQTGNINSTTGEMVSLTWDSAQLGTASGANVELYLNQTAGSTDFIEIGAVEWQSFATSTGQIYLGNSVDGVTIMDTTAAGIELDLGFEDWGAYHEVYSEDPTIVPSDSEYMRVGFGVTAGVGGDSYDELLGMVLEAPNAGYDIHPVVGTAFPPANPYIRSFKHMLTR